MTDRAPSSGPYLSWSRVEEDLGTGRAATIPLTAEGAHIQVAYVISDSGGGIALHVQLARNQRPPRSTLPVINIDLIKHSGLRMARIRTMRPELTRDFHDLICAVADRIVTHRRTLDQAFEETVHAWSALLDSPRALSGEKRIGMIGELIVLQALTDHEPYGWSNSLTSWTGAASEEHDFALSDHDIEVKTTATEERRHTVHGIGQLTPKPGRPLWLLSVQLTRGGASGRTLTECVNAVRTQIAEHAPAALGLFDAKIAASGWSADLPDDEHWSLRSKPLVLAVDSRLPRLDEKLLAAIPSGLRVRIDNVQYRVDLTALDPAPEPPVALRTLRLP